MRVLISGIIGAALATTIWLGTEHYLQSNFGWLVCLVGVFTGAGIRREARSKAPGFLRGTIAIVVTLAAIVGGRQLYAQLVQAGPAAANVTVVSSPDTLPKQDASTAQTENRNRSNADSQSSEVLVQSVPPSVSGAGRVLPKKQRFTQWETIWISLSALAAYVISQSKNSSGESEMNHIVKDENNEGNENN